MPPIDHIGVCICTYKRPKLLGLLLSKLNNQRAQGLFDYSIVVTDNDRAESARHTVESFARESNIPIQYCVEPEQNIALARNMTVLRSRGQFAAFIDDDETPIDDWLLLMYQAILKYKADGAFGPVKPMFSETAPEWMVKADLFERPSYGATGTIIDWRHTGMGNALVRRGVLDELDGPFDRAFGSGGEDVDFFRRAMDRGRIFVWCGEASVFELVPPERVRLSFQLRRALLRGKASLSNPVGRTRGILKSLLAAVLYTLLLPIFLLLGRHVFVKYLVKLFDHLGKLLALARIDVVKEKYVLR